MEEEVASAKQEHPQPTSGIPFSDLGLGESRASLPLFSLWSTLTISVTQRAPLPLDSSIVFAFSYNVAPKPAALASHGPTHLSKRSFLKVV